MYNPQLETFLCVAQCGSFNKAAEKLYISPPAVIKQINLLEESLGLQLFVRTHRGLTLTEAGQSLCQDAKYIIQYCKDSVTRAKNAMQESDSVIRIGTSPMTPAQVLVDLWPKLQEYCPNTKFQLIPFDNTPENAREILGNLGQNIDVAAFNQCENNNCVLMAVENWRYVHPLLKIFRVDWDYTIPFGLLHAPAPSPVVKRFLQAVKQAMQDKHTEKKL